MPQLNPNPWFSIMLMTWFTFLLIIQPKLLSFIQTNSPSTKSTLPHKTTPWTWPWT
uniref:ATP synthase complex subunit 8 n=1 Tax=Chrysococcyx lucidus plagosus TaxID=196527 RepID=Q8LUV4_9AVES|nr:ATPase 8 [Chrysococcyx lucidus plagosus]AAM73949.1 ATPase 8 [Chrysococcyx lucidus plagosus]AAM73951.1 ATPase 8 [Chrysococcyx lucidus plagosus]AAM73953.1 ATPase 8 [Chrysococcyx lucidus plagosus]AAM73955.1 ATPase 8 [Chrysococcyx lucidus plagosus]